MRALLVYPNGAQAQVLEVNQTPGQLLTPVANEDWFSINMAIPVYCPPVVDVWKRVSTGAPDFPVYVWDRREGGPREGPAEGLPLVRGLQAYLRTMPGVKTLGVQVDTNGDVAVTLQGPTKASRYHMSRYGVEQARFDPLRTALEYAATQLRRAGDL